MTKPLPACSPMVSTCLASIFVTVLLRTYTTSASSSSFGCIDCNTKNIKSVVLQSKNDDMEKISILVTMSSSLRVAGVVQARREVSELVSSMVEAGGALPLPEDRLLTIMEAAQVLI